MDCSVATEGSKLGATLATVIDYVFYYVDEKNAVDAIKVLLGTMGPEILPLPGPIHPAEVGYSSPTDPPVKTITNLV